MLRGELLSYLRDKLLRRGTESDTQCNGDALYDNSLAVERSIGKFYKLLIYCLLGVRQCMEWENLFE